MKRKWNLHSLDTVFPHFDDREKSLPLMQAQGHAGDKRGPVHYCSCSYWRLPLQQWCNPIIAAEWITDMPCIQIDRARGGWCRWIALILYLCLMNMCRHLVANLSWRLKNEGWGGRGGGKSFYGELKARRGILCFGHCRLLAWCYSISRCVVFAQFSSSSSAQPKLPIFGFCGFFFMTFICGHVMEIFHCNSLNRGTKGVLTDQPPFGLFSAFLV